MLGYDIGIDAEVPLWLEPRPWDEEEEDDSYDDIDDKQRWYPGMNDGGKDNQL